jgi:hypothetical protein
LLSRILDGFHVTLIEDNQAMNPAFFRQPLAALVLGGIAFLAPMAPALAFSNPPIQMTQGIEYMCGGASREEAAFMRMVTPRWSARIELGINGGAQASEFPVPAKVQVRDKYSGKTVMEALSQGPVMLARLDPGAYDVDVTLGGLTLTESLTVIAGLPAQAVFMWPSNFDMASVTDTLPRTQALLQQPAATAPLQTAGLSPAIRQQAAAAASN